MFPRDVACIELLLYHLGVHVLLVSSTQLRRVVSHKHEKSIECVGGCVFAGLVSGSLV
jgi:hypothetical protein